MSKKLDDTALFLQELFENKGSIQFRSENTCIDFTGTTIGVTKLEFVGPKHDLQEETQLSLGDALKEIFNRAHKSTKKPPEKKRLSA